MAVPNFVRDPARLRSPVTLDRADELLDQESFLRQRIALLERALADAHRLAHHDAVTGIPNRRLLEDRFEQGRARSDRQRKPMAVLFLDVDGFKRINDAHGHVVGDSLLRLVARRLVDCVRSSDTVCRYGGDEFVILLPESDGRPGTTLATRKIRQRLAAPYVVGLTPIEVPTSIGMALYPGDGTELGTLIARADSAMYHEKAGRHTERSAPSTLRMGMTTRNGR